MSRELIIEALDKQLKAKGMTQAQLSEQLRQMDVDIEQIFLTKDCTLGSLEKICQAAGLKWEELLFNSTKQSQYLKKLTQQHEIEFLSNKKLFAVALGVMYFWSFKDILARVKVHKEELLQILERLEAMGFVKLTAPSQYKSMLAPNFNWITDGPIMRMVRRESLDFLSNTFEGDEDILHVLTLFVTAETRNKMRDQLNAIAFEYKRQMVTEASLPADEKQVISLIIAARPWLPGFLQNQMR